MSWSTSRRFAVGVAVVASAVLVNVAVAPSAAAADEAGSGIGRADCGSGSSPETGLQGQVPRRDRADGRSGRGYHCNLSLIGQYQGRGSGVVSPSFEHCAYFGSFFPVSQLAEPRGVQIVDASDPKAPRLAGGRNSTAFAGGTWESLKVDPVHGRLGATSAQVPGGTGGLAFDLYDVREDCANPRLLNPLVGQLTVPAPVIGHEGDFAPDGDTYYATSGYGGVITAIDLKDPAKPRVIHTGVVGAANHGFSISPDGNTMYGVSIAPGGVQVLDISDIQARRPNPQIRQLGQVTWTDGFATQHTLNFTRDGHKFLYTADEGGVGFVRLIDVDDPTRPRVLREYRLQIQLPSAVGQRQNDLDGNSIFGYSAHYCALNRQQDPTRLACSYFQSGVRLFDITDPMSPRELGYYQPPAQNTLADRARLTNSPHSAAIGAPPAFDVTDLLRRPLPSTLPRPSITASTDYCSSPPRFVGDDQLWVSCMDNGFMALRYRP
jgi:hypothetical protein